MSANHPLPLLGATPRTVVAKQGETKCTSGAEDCKRLIGRAIGRALLLAGMEVKAAAFAMGYSDHSALSRWISGVETPQFARLWTVEGLRGPLVIALAELAKDLDVQTVITLRRRA